MVLVNLPFALNPEPVKPQVQAQGAWTLLGRAKGRKVRAALGL